MERDFLLGPAVIAGGVTVLKSKRTDLDLV